MSQTAKSITAQEVVDQVRSDDKAYQDAEVLRFLYHTASMSMRQIGSLFGVSGPTIDYWMQNHGIERRDFVSDKCKIWSLERTAPLVSMTSRN